MADKKSIAGVRRRAMAEDKAIRKAAGKAWQTLDSQAQHTLDSFQNFALKLGIGTESQFSGGTYGFNPISRVRTLLEWMHRGDWLSGVAIDIPAEDMTRAGVEIQGELDPVAMEDIGQAVTALGLWTEICDTIKWARLYGGAICVMMVSGQNPSTPLRPETIGKDGFKGLLTLDRWMVEPTLSDLVQEPGPHLGKPKYYITTTDAPVTQMKIHYSRIIRMEGIKLPYWQRVMENLWGISVLERLYDRMLGFNTATQGAVQLVYKSYIRTYKIKDLKEAVAAGGPAMAGIAAFVNFMATYQSQEGITLIDSEDDFGISQLPGSSGISEILVQLGQQLAGALQIPLVRLFGQSPAGLNATGESDMRTYYDGIKQQQIKYLLVPVTTIYEILARSMGIKWKPGTTLQFNPLWQLTDEERAAVAAQITQTVAVAVDAGLVSPQTALKELKQNSRITGIWSNITPEEIEAVDDLPVPTMEAQQLEQQQYESTLASQQEANKGKELEAQEATAAKESKQLPPAKKAAKDEDRPTLQMVDWHGLTVHIEDDIGDRRSGVGEDGKHWTILFTRPYGYISGVKGYDGDSLDCYLGPDADAGFVYVVYQNKLDSDEFDEHKVMLNFNSMDAAKKCYFDHHDRAGRVFGSMDEVSVQDFLDRVRG